jgi:hypothetical protein
MKSLGEGGGSEGGGGGDGSGKRKQEHPLAAVTEEGRGWAR